jgi:hypothetical protein
MYAHGGSPPDLAGVGSLGRKRYTQYVEQNRTGHCGNKSENRKETYIMEKVLCVIALKSSNGRQTHHTQAGLPPVYCEQALKSGP